MKVDKVIVRRIRKLKIGAETNQKQPIHPFAPKPILCYYKNTVQLITPDKGKL